MQYVCSTRSTITDADYAGFKTKVMNVAAYAAPTMVGIKLTTEEGYAKARVLLKKCIPAIGRKFKFSPVLHDIQPTDTTPGTLGLTFDRFTPSLVLWCAAAIRNIIWLAQGCADVKLTPNPFTTESMEQVVLGKLPFLPRAFSSTLTTVTEESDE